MMDDRKCKVCATAALQEVSEFPLLPRVTSDCVIFRDGGRLLVCGECGAAQSPEDEQWLQEICEIYGSYSAYHQAGGMEQYVFDAESGARRPRSEVILEKLLAVADVPRSGTVLDIGCGNGWTLKAFSSQGGWRLCGLELSDRNLPRLQSITGFEALYTGEIADIPRKFEIVTMVHALEHFQAPVSALRAVGSILAPGGRLFVEVPNAAANPFDYLVADHMLHFSPASLSALAAKAGYRVDVLATDWVNRELSLTATPGAAITAGSRHQAADVAARIRGQIGWLRRFVDEARKAAAAAQTFGLFGTSIAGTWLCGVLGDAVSFFVDEDPHRIGRSHMGRPILGPAQVPRGSVLFIALLPKIAGAIAERLNPNGFELRLPPPEGYTDTSSYLAGHSV
jgi:SAM-dependent methyltransferase